MRHGQTGTCAAPASEGLGSQPRCVLADMHRQVKKPIPAFRASSIGLQPCAVYLSAASAQSSDSFCSVFAQLSVDDFRYKRYRFSVYHTTPYLSVAGALGRAAGCWRRHARALGGVGPALTPPWNSTTAPKNRWHAREVNGHAPNSRMARGRDCAHEEVGSSAHAAHHPPSSRRAGKTEMASMMVIARSPWGDTRSRPPAERRAHPKVAHSRLRRQKRRPGRP